jgi:hypothetical protein
MQNRIDRLEGLVLSLMNNGYGSEGPTAANSALGQNSSTENLKKGYHYPEAPGEPEDDDEDMDEEDGIEEEDEGEDEMEKVSNKFGIMKVATNRAVYIGETHWASILNDVCTTHHSLNDRSLTKTS